MVWFVLSLSPCPWLLSQAHESPDSKIVQVMYLPLAERLMEKYVEEKKVEAEAGMNHWQDEERVCMCVRV